MHTFRHPRSEVRYHRGWVLRVKARSPSAPFNLRPYPVSWTTTYITQTCLKVLRYLGPRERRTRIWRKGERKRDRERGREGGRGAEKCRKGRRRHEELFIKPSSRRISDRVTIHAANTKLYASSFARMHSLEFHTSVWKYSRRPFSITSSG